MVIVNIVMMLVMVVMVLEVLSPEVVMLVIVVATGVTVWYCESDGNRPRLEDTAG